MTGEFDLRALHDAVDVHRRSLALSWAQVAREVGVSTATVQSLGERRSVEGDGVLQILAWLERSPESFVRTSDASIETALPARGAGVLRFDTRSIYEALDARRTERGMTWTLVAEATGIGSAPALTRLRDGGRVAFPAIMKVFAWLDEPAARFVRVARR